MGYGQGKRYHRQSSIKCDDGSVVDATLCGRVLNGRDFKIAIADKDVTCSKCREVIDRRSDQDAVGGTMPSELAKENRMKPLSKRRASRSRNAAKSYYLPTDYWREFEHSETRLGLKRGLPDPHLHMHTISHEVFQQLSQPSPEAAAFAEIALAFCKECLGWKDAHKFNDWGYTYICESVSTDLADTSIPPYERHFHYTHLDKVMEAVRTWLSAMDADKAESQFEGIRSFSFGDFFVGAQDQTGVCRDLMAACVAAHRSRTGIRQDA